MNKKGITEYKCPVCCKIWLSDTITLTKGEIREAKNNFIEVMAKNPRAFTCFFEYRSHCKWSQDEATCRLCKKLTEFVGNIKL